MSRIFTFLHFRIYRSFRFSVGFRQISTAEILRYGTFLPSCTLDLIIHYLAPNFVFPNFGDNEMGHLRNHVFWSAEFSFSRKTVMTLLEYCPVRQWIVLDRIMPFFFPVVHVFERRPIQSEECSRSGSRALRLRTRCRRAFADRMSEKARPPDSSARGSRHLFDALIAYARDAKTIENVARPRWH